MENLTIDSSVNRLTPDQKTQFQEWGYVKGLPVFDETSVIMLQKRFHEVVALLPDDTDINHVNMWHKANRWVHDIARTPTILDYVEDVLGPDFYQWAGQFFIKYPGDGTVVPWHQDRQYWPLIPKKAVSVWLAICDSDDDNGAMQVVRGSHKRGDLSHHHSDDPSHILKQELDVDALDQEKVVTLNLKAGEISLHDEGLVHGSGTNDSNRIRAGLTMRFSPTEVKGDLSVWPTFEMSMARGVDRFGHNPIAKTPTGDGFPTGLNQLSSDFV
jgi:non-heme Fe2+,alpha-ketoglutarate-dependent halogenase